MIKIPKELIVEKIKEKSGLTDAQLSTKVKDKLDQLSGLISEEGALHIIANELGVKILDDPGELQVKNVLAGMRNVEISAKVIQVYETREFDKNGKKGKVGNFLVGDQTGIIRVVAWNDKADMLKSLKEGDMIKIQSGYSRENRGKPEIHLGDKTVVTMLSNANIEVKPKTNERRQIQELKENEDNIEIMGTIVQVFDPRFFTVDSQTGKKVIEKEGKFFLNDQPVQNIDHSYVTNLFLDDGTENIRVVLWKSQTQRLFGMNHEEILANQQAGYEAVKNDLLGKIVKFTGRTNKNQMFDRMEFIAQYVDTNPNPEEEMERLNKVIEKHKQVEEEKEQLAEEVTKEEKISSDNSIDDVEDIDDIGDIEDI